MFFVNIISFVIIKYLPKPLSYCLLGLIGLVGSLHLEVLPLAIDSAMIGVGFFLGGYLIRNYGERLLHMKWFMVVIFLIGNAIMIFLNGYVNLRTCICANIALFWLNGVTATVVFYNVFRIMDLKCSKLLGLKRVLKRVGSDSLIYICINQIILLVLNKVWLSFFASNKIIPLIGFKVIEVILIMLICYSLNTFLSKTPLSIMLGKRYMSYKKDDNKTDSYV